jgi:hypothetical protein
MDLVGDPNSIESKVEFYYDLHREMEVEYIQGPGR